MKLKQGVKTKVEEQKKGVESENEKERQDKGEYFWLDDSPVAHCQEGQW